MRSFITLSESLNGFIRISDVPDQSMRMECCKAFNKLARLQRGTPEKLGGAMMSNPNLHPNGTGLYTHATEHVGDLTNRMAASWATGDQGEGSFGYQFVSEKVARALRYCRNGYGFEREIREQVKRNHQYTLRSKGEAPDFNRWWLDLEDAGERYSVAHAALPVYNEAQWVARQSAIDLGNMDFTSFRTRLERLEAHLGSAEEWADYAGLVAVDSAGKPKPFPH
jgi:hypothetical protein